MDSRFLVTREEFHDVQMDLKRVQSIQQHHSERLRLLEKRQADDAALKSVWNSPFPSALGGTPQHGPVHMPTNELFSDLEEQSHSLLGSLPLEAEDEPTRKGAASRANSVRFDESALHGSNWGAHSGRHSGDFGTIRPGSEMGGHQMMERSLSHKSDGRHSSAGYSVHSTNSGVSGRASSLGLDTNFMIGDPEDDSPLDVPEPPPGLFVLGSAPSIIRCWLTTNFTSSSLLYAVVCTGSQKSTVEYSLLKELELVNNIHGDVDGVFRITLPVFLAEARVTQSNSRSTSPAPQLPSITSSFEVTGLDQEQLPDIKKSIRVFIGSHTLRMHSADLLLSQNSMTLYGDHRAKLSVPFVRPEDDAVFKHLTTANMVPGRQKLNASAPEFVFGDKSAKTSVQDNGESTFAESKGGDNGSEGLISPASQPSRPAQTVTTSTTSVNGVEGEKQASEPAVPETTGKDNSGSTEGRRREPNVAIRTAWRQAAIGSSGENAQLLSGYQPPTRARNMKVLKPTRSTISSSSARTGASYEPAPAPRSSGEYSRRKSGPESSHPPSSSSSGSWGNSNKRSVSSSTTTPMNTSMGNFRSGVELSSVKLQSSANNQHHDATVKGSPTTPTVPRTANNPLGGATAFSWIAQPSQSTTSAASGE
ncbi:hypothetical protein B0H66DRAFT_201458 [Apodospora peruviana]|uniref:Ubiquitin carboxyl-terminal hydrolase 19 n=1 Tax=Apodospora peruviana TaxID=516989 RepID=A0AAE0M7Q0_9PEZI|nr:hypothetical protein B0H66DRAFT_201458 [Apodospora peruviana]